MARKSKPVLPVPTLEELAALTVERGELPSFTKSLPNEVNEGVRIPEEYSEFALKVISAYAKHLGDCLNIYKPLPAADLFHSSQAHIRLISGSNQAGKTLGASIENARIWRGMDPFNKKLERDLLCLVLGKDENHLGQTLWSKLFFPGAFQMLPDEDDGLWRAVRPDPNDPLHLDPKDLVRRTEWRPAPPMLPESWVEQLAYSKRAKDIPSQVVGVNGTKVLFHTSRGAARQGIQLDLAWIDEEVINERWVHELVGPRLVAKGGSFIWSATPEDQTPQFFELLRRAGMNDPDVALFMLQIADNPYYSDEAKERFYNDVKAQGDEVLQVKWYGKPAIAGLAVYPTYNQKVHGIVPFQIPEDWMRVATIDPGTQFSAAVFFAINPEATELHVYDEMLVRNGDADEYARQFRAKADGHYFEIYIIDENGSRVKALGRSDTTRQHYAKAFERQFVLPSRLSGVGFLPGCNKPDARTISLRHRLNDGSIKFHIGRTHLLDQQIQKRYFKKDKPNKRSIQRGIDLVDCLEYGVSYFDKGLYYREPEKPRQIISDYEERLYKHYKDKGNKKHQGAF